MNLIAIKTKPLIGLLLIIYALLIPASIQAQNGPLPEPLTLEAALSTASNPDHFEIALINQKINELQALVGVEERVVQIPEHGLHCRSSVILFARTSWRVSAASIAAG